MHKILWIPAKIRDQIQQILLVPANCYTIYIGTRQATGRLSTAIIHIGTRRDGQGNVYLRWYVLCSMNMLLNRTALLFTEVCDWHLAPRCGTILYILSLPYYTRWQSTGLTSRQCSTCVIIVKYKYVCHWIALLLIPDVSDWTLVRRFENNK